MTGPEPGTQAGRLLVMAGLTFHSGRRLADSREMVVAIEAEAAADERKRIAAAVDAVLSDEPVLDPTPPGAIWRWYSEGWNRCARDVRAAILRDAP